MDGEDVGMGKCSDRFRLALESGARVWFFRQVRGEDLDSYIAIELGIVRSIDLAHSTGAERREDLV
jgi:hypothetical protein